MPSDGKRSHDIWPGELTSSAPHTHCIRGRRIWG